MAYIEHEYGGVIPPFSVDQSLNRLVWNGVGAKWIAERLYLTAETAVPFLVVILIDTIMNVSSALSLSAHCMHDTENAGEKWILWSKPRAQTGSLSGVFAAGPATCLNVESNEPISAPRAIECLLVLRRRLVPFASHADQDTLFLVARNSSVRFSSVADRVGPLRAHSASDTWNRLRERNPLLALFDLRMDLIRSTQMQNEAIVTGNDIIRLNQIAQHANFAETQHYIDNKASRDVDRGQIREVQDYLLCAATVHRKDIRENCGVTEERAAEILRRARRKGFLGWKLDSDSETPGDDDDFVTWMMGEESLVLDDNRVAAEMLAFKSHIIREAPVLRPTRSWEDIWAPFLLFLNLALMKMPPDTREAGARIAADYEVTYVSLD